MTYFKTKTNTHDKSLEIHSQNIRRKLSAFSHLGKRKKLSVCALLLLSSCTTDGGNQNHPRLYHEPHGFERFDY